MKKQKKKMTIYTKRQYLIMALLGIIAFLGVGYAYLNTNINIMANLNIKKYLVLNKNYISVEKFGANGGDNNDDTQAIQDAINSLLNNDTQQDGGTIYFPSGNYYISSPIVIDTAIALLGENKETTNLIATTSLNTIIITKDYNTYMVDQVARWNDTMGVPQNFSISNLTINGNNKSQNGIQMYAYDFTLKKLNIVNCTENGILEHWANTSGDTWNTNESKFFESFLEDIYIDNCNTAGINWGELTDSFLKDIEITDCGIGIQQNGNIYLQKINISECTTGIQTNNQTFLNDITISSSNAGIVFSGWHIVANNLKFENNQTNDIKVTSSARYLNIEDVVIEFESKSTPSIVIDAWNVYTAINDVKIRRNGNTTYSNSIINVLGGNQLLENPEEYNILLNNILLYNIRNNGPEINVADNLKRIKIHAASTNGVNNLYNAANNLSESTLDSNVSSGFVTNNILNSSTFSSTALNNINEQFKNNNYNLVQINNNPHVVNIKSEEFHPNANTGTLGWWDDSIPIQNAINSLRETGGIVYIPSGTYGIKNPITLYSNITLLGDGEKATTIYLGNNVNKKMLVTEENSHNFEIKNIGFFGNKYNDHNISEVGLQIEGSNFNIENVWINGVGGDSIYITSTDNGSTYSTIKNLNVKYCDGKGVVYNGSNKVYTDMLTISGCEDTGLEINSKSHFGFMHLYANGGSYQFIDNAGAKIQTIISESSFGKAVLYKGENAITENLQIYSNRDTDIVVDNNASNTKVSIVQCKSPQHQNSIIENENNINIYLKLKDGIIIN